MPHLLLNSRHTHDGQFTALRSRGPFRATSSQPARNSQVLG
jgi:hypothetical protein